KPYSNTRRQGWKRVQASAAGAGAGGMGAHSRAWSEALSPGWSQGSAARPWICLGGPWPLVAAAGCGQAGVVSPAGDPDDPPPRPGLGARLRLWPAGAVPRGHVLRELGLARQKSRGRAGDRTAHVPHVALAAVAAVPGVGGGDRIPARAGQARTR